ncbi:hypothetical protein DFH28DRAFT_900545, partial [Melampsora americana]
NRAKIELEKLQEEIEDQRSKLNFLKKIYQDSKNSNLSNDPDGSVLLSEFGETVDQYKRQLTEVELAYEMKKNMLLKF